ncbi:MAG: MerR family transcriptional regulator [Clostridiales bacterium]|nr:MerR family transcriptional regulator [Clostridiales bacterium]
MELNEKKLGNSSKKFRVSEVAAWLNITPRILKHYESTGVIAPQRTDDNDYREYSAEDVIKIQLAERLKSTQFSQKEIGEYFSGKLDIEKKYAELIKLREMVDNLIDVLDVDRRNGAPQFYIQDEISLLCFCKTYPTVNNTLQQYLNSRDADISAISAGCVCDVTHEFFKQYDNLYSFPRIDGVEEKFDNETYRVCVPILSPPKTKDYDGTVETVTRKKSLTMKFALGGAPLVGDGLLKNDGRYRGGGFYLQEEAARLGLTLTGKSWMVSETGPNKKTSNRTYTVVLGAEIE